jgi:hypothetical protein
LAAGTDDERQRLRDERAQVDATFAARDHECRQHFIVTACVDQARRDRRQAMESLRRRQLLLDDADRKQRAAERNEEIRSKVEARDRPAGMAQRTRDASPVAETPREAAHVAPRGPAAAHGNALHSREDEARHIEEFEQRRKDAEEHRVTVQRRNAARAASGKLPAKPLPVPGEALGASAPH